MKIGVYVGSFNPVHKGHIKIVKYLLEKHLDKVIIMPTGAYWNKTDFADIRDRINMLSFFENDKIIVEKNNNDLPYTYLVMEYLSEKYKTDELLLIIGADNIVNFDKWKNYTELLKYGIIIVNRKGIEVKYYLDKLKKNSGYFITDGLENIDISSTDIRKLIRENNYSELDRLLDNRVKKYIIDNHIYEEAK